MRIEYAYRQERSTTGQLIDFAVFYAKANNDTDSARKTWLAQLTTIARQVGKKVDVAALVYEEHRQTKWWGDPFVVDFINKNGVPPITNYLEFQ
jgi:hypothetical protein